MGSTSKRGYWFPDGVDEVSNFPGQTGRLFMGKLDSDMDHALTGPVAATRVSGTLATGRIPNLPASQITSGQIAPARLPLASDTSPGSMSTNDKRKLDSATTSATGHALVIRYGSGQIAVPAIPDSDNVAASKKYVDTAVAAGGGNGGGAQSSGYGTPTKATVAATGVTAKSEVTAHLSDDGIVKVLGQVILNSSFTNGQVIATLPKNHYPPTMFSAPIVISYSPPPETVASFDILTLNPNNGEITATARGMAPGEFFQARILLDLTYSDPR